MKKDPASYWNNCDV